MHDEGGVMLMSEERYKIWLWEKPILIGEDRLYFFDMSCMLGLPLVGWRSSSHRPDPEALPLRITVSPARTESFTSTLRTEGSGADSGQSGSSW